MIQKLSEVLERVRELSEKATKGPWDFHTHVENLAVIKCSTGAVADVSRWDTGAQYPSENIPNAELIAEYRSICPRLASALEICLKAFAAIDDLKQLPDVHDDLSALAFASRLALCQSAKNEALNEIDRIVVGGEA